MRKFESLQKDESRAHSADFSKAYGKLRFKSFLKSSRFFKLVN